MQDFIVIRPLFCSYKHKVQEKSTCKDCLALVGFAKYLEMGCIVELSTAYKKFFPLIGYKADQAVRKVMQMPVSVVQMSLQGPGSQKLFVIANVPGMDVQRFARLAEKCLPQTQTKTVITKAMLKDLCNLASSESDRLLIKFACCKGQNLSSNDSSKIYGFSNLTKQETKINEAISTLREVREAVDMLATVKDKAILQGFGLTISSDEDSLQDESGSNSEAECNWISEEEEDVSRVGTSALEQESGERATNTLQEVEDKVVTDTESDNPDDWLNLDIQKKVKQRRYLNKKKHLKIFAKKKAEQQLLKRKVPKVVSKVVNKFPNIGRDIEEFVCSRKVGADAWRRTGVLTFDGNTKTGPKATYTRIQKHLEKKYHTKFGYGTIVQLCVVRNKRRLSAKRYKGVAKITCRRARKGFSIKLNPDAHWNTATYRGLDDLQLKDGMDKVILNRDDASGFRLDTTYTHKQHKGVQLIDAPDTTTRVDYVNKYTSVLQTTSYLFPETGTTLKICVGVVKPHILYEKSPAQHMADLNMLCDKVELSHAFKTSNGKAKDIWCVRVDGAGDEGPSHKEVAFLWTEKHLNEEHHLTCVTTRHSRGSYINEVELMNGCLAVAHSNLYIPSTLGGPVNDASGFNEVQLRKNLDLATDVYISRVQGAPCGEANIHSVKGASGVEAIKLLDRRTMLITFLSGKAEEKKELQQKHPDDYAYFQKVWNVYNSHKRVDIPDKYFVFLSLCYKKKCPHPKCNTAESSDRCWYEGGPPLTYFPLPVPDPTRPWGADCSGCQGPCPGHYMKPREAWLHVQAHGNKVFQTEPPSVVLQREFDQSIKEGKNIIEDEVKKAKLAKDTHLTVQEITMWLNHLHDVKMRRSKGAKKAAATRAAKKG